jgi:hypothetical protein
MKAYAKYTEEVKTRKRKSLLLTKKAQKLL